MVGLLGIYKTLELEMELAKKWVAGWFLIALYRDELGGLPSYLLFRRVYVGL